MLRVVGIDADITDLSPINPSLFKELKKFDLIHTTDQLFTMAKTAIRYQENLIHLLQLHCIQMRQLILNFTLKRC